MVGAMNYEELLNAKEAHRKLGLFRRVKRLFTVGGKEVDFFAEFHGLQEGSEWVVTEGEDFVGPRDFWARNQESDFQLVVDRKDHKGSPSDARGTSLLRKKAP